MDVFVRSLRSLGVAVGLLLSSGFAMSSAMAASITYNFSGDVTGVNPLLASQFNTSQRMSGSMTVNTTDTNPNANLGSYNIQDFRVMIGNYTATMGTSGVVDVRNGPAFDFLAVTVNSPVGNNVNFLAPREFDALLFGPNNIFTSDALPNPAPSIASFTFPEFRLFFGPQGAGASVSGALTSLTAVPLPASVILFGVGLVALIGLGTGGLRNLRVPQA